MNSSWDDFEKQSSNPNGLHILLFCQIAIIPGVEITATKQYAFSTFTPWRASLLCGLPFYLLCSKHLSLWNSWEAIPRVFICLSDDSAVGDH